MIKTTLAIGVLACAALTVSGCQSNHSGVDAATMQQSSVQQIQRAAALVRDAQRLELSGDDKGAVEKYRAAIVEYNELPVAWNNLGRLMMKSGENLGAAEAFKNASELSPTDPVPLHNLGTLWESLGYLPDASKWYDSALKRDENYLPSLRRWLLVQELQSKNDALVTERLRRALLLENDPWWVTRFKRMHQQNEITAGAPGTSSK